MLFFTENEPSDRETEIWKELQVTRLALSRAEEELKQSHADKDSFLNTLSRIAVKKIASNLVVTISDLYFVFIYIIL